MNEVAVGAFSSARRTWRSSMPATARASAGSRYASATLPLAVTRRVTSPWSSLTTWIMVCWSTVESGMVLLLVVTQCHVLSARILLAITLGRQCITLRKRQATGSGLIVLDGGRLGALTDVTPTLMAGGSLSRTPRQRRSSGQVSPCPGGTIKSAEPFAAASGWEGSGGAASPEGISEDETVPD